MKLFFLILFIFLIGCSQIDERHYCDDEDKYHSVCSDMVEQVCGSDDVKYINGCKACQARIEYYEAC